LVHIYCCTFAPHYSYMKRIERHRAILGVNDKATLSDLKKVYRKIMMEWHPDKFQDSEDAKKEADGMAS